MVYYLLQTITFQLCFLLVYDVFLKRETFFNWNRAYLLFTTLLSVFLPFIKIESFKKAVPEQFVVALPEVFLGQTNKTIQLDPVIIKGETTEVMSLFSWQYLFYLGMLVALILFVFKLYKVIILIKSNPQIKYGKLSLVRLFNSTNAFSFFNYVFLGEQLSQKEKASILRHEMVHVNQKHTLDLLFFELLRIVFWFNPLVYIYQNKLITLHEFIADSQAVKHQGKKDYYQNLLAQVFQTKRISFINPFYKQSLIKKRIVMLQKSKSNQVYLLKYVILIPVVLAMLFFTSCVTGQNENDASNSITNQIEVLKSLLEEKKGALTQAEKEELLRLIKDVDFSPLENSPWKVSAGVNKVSDSVMVPFSVVEHVPVFPGCESLNTNEEKRKCFSEKISNFVGENFNTDLGKELGLSGRQRINVIFKIDTEGNIGDIRSRAPHTDLEAEAIRVINKLPKMTPGKQKGKLVKVAYSLPIVFAVTDENTDKKG
ncbi:M56 family metallopeptidase [Tamlana sp. 62-3]|uniref:M56 family metallopeptidase n=1 Tax=Neotamlana sargassicola TaxID=2883125 RepID=A0A9X1I4D8_9FLAO|nr:M56 family metallopeptidase [Tamlana sargassicola]MCB4807572.1 M56 family metallopeptidase [Tamlana sargassicola]